MPAALTIYAIFISEFLMRYNMDKPIRPSETDPGRLTRNLKLQLMGLYLITFFVYVRCAFLSFIAMVCRLT